MSFKNTLVCLPNQEIQGKVRELHFPKKCKGRIKEFDEMSSKSGKYQGNYLALLLQ